MRTTSFGCVLGCSLVFGLGACGDDNSDPTRVEQRVGSSGGTVTLDSGASVSLPSGALAEDVLIAIEAMDVADTPAPPAGVSLTGRAYAFTPHGLAFAVPITITLSSGAAVSDPVVVRLDDERDTEWAPVAGAMFAGNVATVQANSFSIYGVGSSTAPPTDSGTPPTDSGTPPTDSGTPPTDSGAPTCCTSSADCMPDQGCVEGSCRGGAPPCGFPASVLCGMACVDIANDPAHCGACGVVCGAGNVCMFGTCIGAPACASDGDCPPSYACLGGTCTPSC